MGNDNDVVTASDLLTGGFDPTRLHPMAGLKDQLEYLQLDDDKLSDMPGSSSALPSRGWSDDLCYGTGTTYLSGPYLSLLLTPIQTTRVRLQTIARLLFYLDRY